MGSVVPNHPCQSRWRRLGRCWGFSMLLIQLEEGYELPALPVIQRNLKGKGVPFFSPGNQKTQREMPLGLSCLGRRKKLHFVRRGLVAVAEQIGHRGKALA